MFCAKDYEQGFHRHLLSFVMRFPLLFLSSALVQGADAAPLSYNRDIRPILAENCFACHGPDAQNRQMGLRLDSLEGMVGARTGFGGALLSGLAFFLGGQAPEIKGLGFNPGMY